MAHRQAEKYFPYFINLVNFTTTILATLNYNARIVQSKP